MSGGLVMKKEKCRKREGRGRIFRTIRVRKGKEKDLRDDIC